MSIQELEARIEEISSEVDRQKEILGKLERDKSLLQRQLNAIRDPITRLPLEISSEIFFKCLPDRPTPDGRSIPTRLLGVCNTWTNIALSNPELWSRIHVCFPCPTGFKEVLPKWIQRAGARGLHISMEGLPDPDVLALIWCRSDRLETLHISSDVRHWRDDWDDGPRRGPCDVLAGTQPGQLPCLRTLTILGLDGLVFHRQPVLQLLRLSPNLVDLSFHDFKLEWENLEWEDAVSDEIILADLRQLLVGMKYPDASMDAVPDYKILDSFSAPRLETLTVDSDDRRIVPFLARSSPPLQQLLIRDALEFDSLKDLLTAVPSLTRLSASGQHESRRFGELVSYAGSPIQPGPRPSDHRTR